MIASSHGRCWKRIRPILPILTVLPLVSLGVMTACEHKETKPTVAAAQPASTLNSDRKSDGPGLTTNPFPHEKGNAAAGRDVFRFETFGNEGFWTDAMRMPEGMMDEKITPIMALKAGLQVDSEAIPSDLKDVLAAELKTDLSIEKAPLLNDPATTVKLINANAVVGMVPKDSNGDGKLDITKGDKVGVACTICHTVTDKSVYSMPKGGSIGKRIDGLANLDLDMGMLLAVAANSRAYYPNLQVTLGGKTHGRAPKGLTKDSTEADVDAYLKNREFYPVGTFDETQDGNGNPVKNAPLFRQDLAAPYGSAGEFGKLDDISNASYTTNLDMTTMTTPEGVKFLTMLGGAAGAELARDYAQILKDTGVTGFPYVQATMVGKPGEPANPVGRRVNNKKLLDMNAYLDSLQAPAGAKVDTAASAHGRELFRAKCTMCHNVDQSKFVPPTLVDLQKVWPAYKPAILAARAAPLDAIQDSPGTFDDKMIVVDASIRGQKRGNALPLLLDLDRTTIFLHDASGSSLDVLLHPRRGATAPHPFYFNDPKERADMVSFLRSLDTSK